VECGSQSGRVGKSDGTTRAQVLYYSAGIFATARRIARRLADLVGKNMTLGKSTWD